MNSPSVPVITSCSDNHTAALMITAPCSSIFDFDVIQQRVQAKLSELDYVNKRDATTAVPHNYYQDEVNTIITVFA